MRRRCEDGKKSGKAFNISLGCVLKYVQALTRQKQSMHQAEEITCTKAIAGPMARPKQVASKTG